MLVGPSRYVCRKRQRCPLHPHAACTGNNLGPRGAKTFAPCLRKLVSLKILSLGCTKEAFVGGCLPGLTAVAAAALMTLSAGVLGCYAGTNLGAEGTMALAPQLGRLLRLKELYIHSAWRVLLLSAHVPARLL